MLETIAISFLFSWRNSYHSSTFLGSSNAISAGLFDFKYEVISYFNLKEINETLQKENSVLKEKTLNKELILGKRFLKIDDKLFYKQYKFQEAKIINSQFINRITREYIDDQISVDEAVDKINAELAKF